MDANQILGMLMESGMARSGQSRVQRLAGSGQGGGGLASIAGALLGSGSQPGGGGGIADIAGALLGGGGNRGGGIAGALLGGSGRGGVAATGGAMGILGSLAGMAMQHFGSAQDSAAPGLAEQAAPFDSDDTAADPDSRATVMIRAMISAAKADGQIDPQEKQRILGRLEAAGADPDARAFVQAEMAKPVDVDAIVSAIDSPQMAVEAYTASLFAIDVDTPAEARYMRQLAMSLRLDPVLVRSLHQSLEPAA